MADGETSFVGPILATELDSARDALSSLKARSAVLRSVSCDGASAAQPVRDESGIAAAQARRDRARLLRAQDEIAILRARVSALENSPSRRALAPARRAFYALPPGLRNFGLRLLGFSQVLAASAGGPTEPVSLQPRGRALVIDDHWPQPDRDSGSIDIVNLTDALRDLRFEVTFAAAKAVAGEDPVRDRLARTGIRCLGPADVESIETFLIRSGNDFDLFVLCRVYCGGNFLEIIQATCTKSRIIFNSIDLCYLREERRARIQQDTDALEAALRTRDREEHLVRSCDATMVVSEAESDLLARDVPDALTIRMPLARPIHAPANSFERRRGIGFIGGFAHLPNVDAVRYFLAEIWPLVLRDLPDCEFSIVGTDFPAMMTENCPGQVRALGHLPEISPWFESLRLTIAPLRFGAGAKGKVASSLANGVPCVVTPLAAEGMALSNGGGVLVAQTPDAFAAAIREVHTDAALWGRLSQGALAHARHDLSLEAWQAQFDGMLQRIGM